LRRSLILVTSLWLAVVAGVGVGQERRSTIGVDEIQPGMRGYGLTVFRGTAPERFDVEVIDVLHNFRPDMDLILVRTDHPILDHASTVAGMSGSPIYLDGRLAGAYAYGWPFGKDPVAGVTPIASMFEEMQRPVRPDSFPGAERLAPPRRRPRALRVDSSRSPRLAGLRPYLGEEPRGAFAALDEHAREAGVIAQATGPRGMRRASTPIMLGGVTDSVANLLAERLEPLGLMALQAGGAAASPAGGAPPRFVDGGGIGVQLIRGDISATGIGTVTHVGRGRVAAFGHPMLNAGEVGLPTSTARVLHILASESRSFKLAEALDPLGTLIQDRQPAIIIDTSLQAETIPVHIRIRGVDGAPRTDWNVEVASHRALTPMLVFAAIANAIETTAADQTDVVYTARSRVTIEGHAPVEVVDQGYMAAGPNDAHGLGRLRLFSLMDVAYGNPFEETRVRAVDLDIEVRFERDFYEIVDASVMSDEVDPGGQANVHVVLRRRGQPDETRILPVTIPTHAAGKSVEITIQAGDDVRLEHRQARNVSDLLHVVREQLPSTSMVVSLKMPTRGLTFRGHVVRDLPASALDTLQMVNDTENSAPFVTYDRQSHAVGSVLGGSATLTLRVRETPRRR
jgi:hypothetical protein